jgi:hypothetical protein
VGELAVEDGQLSCDGGRGTISGTVPCEQLRQLLSHRYGDFLGQPFALRHRGLLMVACLLTSSTGDRMKFVYTPGPSSEKR